MIDFNKFYWLSIKNEEKLSFSLYYLFSGLAGPKLDIFESQSLET